MLKYKDISSLQIISPAIFFLKVISEIINCVGSKVLIRWLVVLALGAGVLGLKSLPHNPNLRNILWKKSRKGW